MISLTRIAALMTLLMLAVSTTVDAQSWWSSSSSNKAFLGVESNRLSKQKVKLLELDNAYGVMIDRIVENSAAEEAGLQPFDYLVAIDDEEMGWTTELSDLLSKYENGDRATVHYIRKGKKESVDVTFKRKRDESFSMNFRKSIFGDDDPFLGVSEHRSSEDSELGVTVNVVDGSTADDMGLRDGDVVTAINGYKMIDWSDISRAINMLSVDEEIKVDFEREGKKYSEAADIKTKPSRRTSINELWTSRSSSNNRAFLGIYSEELSSSKAEKLGIENRYGSYVTSVFENSAAKEAGLQPFDYIYGIDEYRVGKDQSLTSILRKYEPGEKAEVLFIRQGKNLKYNITFGKRSKAVERKRSRCEDPFLGVQENSRSSGEKGIRVDVVRNSTAAELGLKSGDVIASINNFPIIDWGDVGPAVDMMEVGDNLSISYFRAGQKMKAEGKIGSYCDTYGKRDNWNFGSFWDDDEEDRDVEDMEVEIENLSSDDIEEINDDYDLRLSTSNNLQVNDLKFIPNEDLEVFSLQFEIPSRGETKIKIYNERGRQIYSYDLGNFSGEFSDEVDLMQSGTDEFVILVTQSGKSTVKKINLDEK